MRDLNFGETINRASLYIALAAAWIALSGSLYFSEVLHYVPCVLCWYQRILMYPLAGILVIGLLRQDINLPYYVLPFSLLGQAIATYHYMLEKTNIFPSSPVCSSGVPCNVMWINWWGFVTIPFLAMAAFFIITIMCLLAMVNGLPEYNERRQAPWWLIIGLPALIVGSFLLLARDQEENWLDLTTVPGGAQSTVAGTSPATLPGTTPAATAALTSVDSSALPETLARGATLYSEACAACHGADAGGVAGVGTALLNADSIHQASNAEALALIRQGIAVDDPRNTTGMVMPASGGRPDLSDADIYAIVEYLRSLSSAPQ